MVEIYVSLTLPRVLGLTFRSFQNSEFFGKALAHIQARATQFYVAWAYVCALAFFLLEKYTIYIDANKFEY